MKEKGLLVVSLRGVLSWKADIVKTIIPRARMGSESIAIDSEAMRARGIIVLVKSN